MKRIILLSSVMLAFFASLPLLGWWLLSSDTQESSGTPQPEIKRASDVPKPDLTLPPVRTALPDPMRIMRDPLKVLDPDARSKPEFEMIELADGTYEYRIDGTTRGIYKPEHKPENRRSWLEFPATSDRWDWSYNPELRKMGLRIGLDGKIRRIAGDGEIPIDADDLPKAQGSGR